MPKTKSGQTILKGLSALEKTRKTTNIDKEEASRKLAEKKKREEEARKKAEAAKKEREEAKNKRFGGKMSFFNMFRVSRTRKIKQQLKDAGISDKKK